MAAAIAEQIDTGNVCGLLTKCVCQDGWISAKFFFYEFMDRDGVEVHKLVKKERGQYPAILGEQAWSIEDLLYGFLEKFFLRDAVGGPERAR